MIHTVIFDIGRVLVKFEWREYLEGFHFDAETEAAVARATFGNPLWAEFDRSSVPDEALLRQMIALAPEHEREIRLVYDHFPASLVQFPYTVSWITSLRERGFKVYYLSNYPASVRDRNPKPLDFLPLCDGGILSCNVHMIKPEPGIYQTLFDQYHIDPAHAVFIDDSERNLAGARAMGLNTIQFIDHEQAVRDLEALLADKSNPM